MVSERNKEVEGSVEKSGLVAVNFHELRRRLFVVTESRRLRAPTGKKACCLEFDWNSREETSVSQWAVSKCFMFPDVFVAGKYDRCFLMNWYRGETLS